MSVIHHSTPKLFALGGYLLLWKQRSCRPGSLSSPSHDTSDRGATQSHVITSGGEWAQGGTGSGGTVEWGMGEYEYGERVQSTVLAWGLRLERVGRQPNSWLRISDRDGDGVSAVSGPMVRWKTLGRGGAAIGGYILGVVT
eukprot:8570195-Pyramimonas_sp.AAC.1